MKITTPNFATLLNEAGYKATPKRILLLQTLWQEKKPVAVSDIQNKLKKVLDKVSLYRALDSFTASGILRRIDFRQGHAYYELSILRDHHHHIVCTDCGTVEDAQCTLTSITKKIVDKSTRFKIVNDHSMEFFGLCNSCAK